MILCNNPNLNSDLKTQAQILAISLSLYTSGWGEQQNWHPEETLRLKEKLTATEETLSEPQN